ncbi:hypothetical protein AUP68_05012 [Ilyonectria robusta]
MPAPPPPAPAPNRTSPTEHPQSPAPPEILYLINLLIASVPGDLCISLCGESREPIVRYLARGLSSADHIQWGSAAMIRAIPSPGLLSHQMRTPARTRLYDPRCVSLCHPTRLTTTTTTVMWSGVDLSTEESTSQPLVIAWPGVSYGNAQLVSLVSRVGTPPSGEFRSKPTHHKLEPVTT